MRPVPHLLHHRNILRYSALFAVLKVLSLILLVLLPPYFAFSRAITPTNIIELTNDIRESAGLPSLTPNTALTRAAEAKAKDMLEHQYFAHTSPAGTSTFAWVKAEGYVYLYSGENLAVHFETSEQVQGGWMASTGHRANILNPRFTEIGVGVVSGNFEGVPSTFVVQEFGRAAP